VKWYTSSKIGRDRRMRTPSPIGVTVVELLAIKGNVLRVRGLDVLNGSPVLDLKPE
jgi:tRNA (Thr-GGU) A37 N-methylase